MRFKLTIEYTGTRYSGWQIQKNARTIQGETDQAVRAVTGRGDSDLHDAGDRRQGPAARSTTVLVERLEIVEDGDLVLVGIEGSHFLWKMVRRITGVLVEIGRGRLEMGDAGRLVAEEGAPAAALTAPP